MPLVERLVERGFQVLMTTGTVTSANLLAARLPAGSFHQYMPLDLPIFLQRFLDHWQPSIALVAESEIWPNMFFETQKSQIPLILVNARMSERSFQRWQKFPNVIGALLARLDMCLAQSQDDADRLHLLGASYVKFAGNLKYDVAPLPVDGMKLADLTAQIGSRPVWVAASTHAGEEEIVAQVHLALSRKFPLVTIVVPRHPRRGKLIAEQAHALGVKAALRSQGAGIEGPSAFYIADTIGELGLFYRLASLAFLGKSLTSHGGQNPIEPAKLGCAILHGPFVQNFADVYRQLDDAQGALCVESAEDLIKVLSMMFDDSARLREISRTAGEVVGQFGGASDQIMRNLEPFFQQIIGEPG
jgi:3-deoxy-D-manno-octulosonic-acid transferase